MIPTQPGDVADRYTILLLKKQHLNEVAFELEVYAHETERLGIPQTMIDTLLKINGAIWELEADIRNENHSTLGATEDEVYREIGRRTVLIRKHNSQRVALKNALTRLFGGFPEHKVEHSSARSATWLPPQQVQTG